MGEYAEMMIDGSCCTVCGEFIGPSGGYPRKCAGCQEIADREQNVAYRCRVCTKRFGSEMAVRDHMRAKHP